mmetsp:Transcript_41252/g.100677  ORF Transcript_41252/g.100677 Transcript_41252/m.100677 type:complete len:100 (+) Transcript_41252:1644-1943(+)
MQECGSNCIGDAKGYIQQVGGGGSRQDIIERWRVHSDVRQLVSLCAHKLSVQSAVSAAASHYGVAQAFCLEFSLDTLAWVLHDLKLRLPSCQDSLKRSI